MTAAKLDVLGDIDRRGAIRFDIGSPSTLRLPGGAPIDVDVDNFSRTGFRFRADIDLPVGTLVSLGLSGAGARAARVIRRRDDAYGCMFLTPVSHDALAQAFPAEDEVLVDLSAALIRYHCARAAKGSRGGLWARLFGRR